MSNLSTHSAQAEHNKKLSSQLSESEFVDWSITCAFYAALHFVEAAFTCIPKIEHTEKCHNLHWSDMDEKKAMHAFREMLIAKEFPTIRAQYSHLRTSSEAARYLDRTAGKSAFKFFKKSDLKKILSGLEVIQKVTQHLIKK